MTIEGIIVSFFGSVLIIIGIFGSMIFVNNYFNSKEKEEKQNP